MAGFLYFMSSRKGGPIYTGVRADLGRRVLQHKERQGSAFCRRYGLTKLVYCEAHDRIDDAIAHEKRVKRWRRAWKIALIEKNNPNWDDLFATLNS